jgi:plasmid maintenance system killer protein
MIPHVTSVRVVDQYRVHLTFADGASGEVDLEPRMWGPVFEPLLQDRDLFNSVRVNHEWGCIEWPNGVDWSPETLHALVTTGVVPGE